MLVFATMAACFWNNARQVSFAFQQFSHVSTQGVKPQHNSAGVDNCLVFLTAKHKYRLNESMDRQAGWHDS